MLEDRWTEVDGYINGLFAPATPAMEAALEAAKRARLPAIQVTPSQGKLLYILACAIGARSILEIGTLGAYSTIWLAQALPADGKLITLEADQRHAEVARANLERAGLAEVVEVRLGCAQDSLPVLLAEGRGPFDLVFIDADKPSYPEYLAWALKLTHPGSLIVADNVVRDGAVADPSSEDESAQGARRFNAALAAEPRLISTAIQTVGSKGYDGFAIALVSG
jgi:predicted O-methyltransferase YrrM